MSSMTHATAHITELRERRRILGPAYRLFYDQPIHLVRGEDVWLFDAAGKRYLDAYNNVPVVGHANPAVVEALARQASVLNTHTRYLSEGVVEYAERLQAHFPAALDTVMLTCTGSEANDLALRIAFEATGRRGIIVTRNAYHGVTQALADMSPSLRPVASHVRTIDAPCNLAGSPEQVADQFALLVDEAACDLAQAGIPVAVLIVDTVFASDGIHIGYDEVLSRAAAQVRRHGGLFIADEVQGGFSRIGRHWWAFQRDNVIPDMVSLGKPMGNGHPMAGLVVQRPLVEAFGKNCRYFNTFGGNTVSAAVGLAVLNELERMEMPAHVARVGEVMADRLLHLAKTVPCIGAVRGQGLYWGVDIRDPGGDSARNGLLAQAISNGLRNEGILIGVSGRQGDALKIRPPLTFQAQHVDLLVSALARQCQALLSGVS